MLVSQSEQYLLEVPGFNVILFNEAQTQVFCLGINLDKI